MKMEGGALLALPTCPHTIEGSENIYLPVWGKASNLLYIGSLCLDGKYGGVDLRTNHGALPEPSQRRVRMIGCDWGPAQQRWDYE